MQVIPKFTSFLIILSDPNLRTAWERDKLTRVAAFENLRAVDSQMTELTGFSLNEYRLPAAVNLRPVRAGETRVIDGGVPVVAAGEDDCEMIPLPLDMLTHDFRLAVHTVDRCSVGASMLHFVMNRDVVWFVKWDWFHGLWDDIKNVGKRCLKGRMWRSILEVTALVNMNSGPYKSNAWFVQKKEALAHLLATGDLSDPELVQDLQLFAESNGWPTGSREELEAVRDRLRTMSSCNEVGPTVKLMRWLSIQEGWSWIKSEFYGLRAVLRLLRSSTASTGDNDPSGRPGATSGVQESVDQPAPSTKKGRIENAPQYITELNYENLQVFCGVTKPLRERYSARAMFTKHPQQGLEYDLRKSLGEWEADNFALLRRSFADAESLSAYGLVYEGHARVTDTVVEFALSLAAARLRTEVAREPCIKLRKLDS